MGSIVVHEMQEHKIQSQMSIKYAHFDPKKQSQYRFYADEHSVSTLWRSDEQLSSYHLETISQSGRSCL